MKKGRITNILSLPKITIEDEQGKTRVVEISGINIHPLKDFEADLKAYNVIKSYRYKPIDYQLSKVSGKAKVWVGDKNQLLVQILLENGAGQFNESEASTSNLFTPGQIASFRSATPNSSLSPRNYIHDNKNIKKQQPLLLPGTYDLISIKNTIILSTQDFYFSVNPANLELCCLELDHESVDHFVGRHLTVGVTNLKISYNLVTRGYRIDATFEKGFQLDVVREGFGKLSLKAGVQLEKEVYDEAVSLTEKAKLSFKGFWKNSFDLFSLLYVKSNFLGKVIEVVEGHIYKIKNMLSSQIVTIELASVMCPTGQQLGAFEARDFARREFIGRFANVYIKKETVYVVQGDMVRTDDHEPFNKVILSNGWGHIKQDFKNESEFARLNQLVSTAIDTKIGLFSAAKKKVGIVRFEDLTSLNNKETISRAKEFNQDMFKRTAVDILDHYTSGVVEGFKQNDIFKVRLNSKKAILNLKIQGVKNLDSKLMVTELKTFRENSMSFLVENLLQREVEIRLIELNLETESFVGEIMLERRDVAEMLLKEGLVYIDDSWYVSPGFHLKEEEARVAKKGVWNSSLMKIRGQKPVEEIKANFKATVSQIIQGQVIYYQSQASKSKLSTEVTPFISNLTTPLPKQLIKIGNICAAPFEGQLYRVRITSFVKKNENLVGVLYIDYGNSAKVEKGSLVVIPEEIMMVEELATRGELAFVKPLKQSNDSYDSTLEDIQNLLLEKQFNLHIEEDSVILFEDDIESDHILDSVNLKLVESGLLKLNRKSLFNINPETKEKMIELQELARGQTLGTWGGYESQSDIEDQMKMYIKGESTPQTKTSLIKSRKW